MWNIFLKNELPHIIELRIISDFERKSIVASANAQDSTGAPVSFHPGRDPESPFEIMRIFSEAGGNPKRAICSHLESKISVKLKLPGLLKIILLYP